MTIDIILFLFDMGLRIQALKNAEQRLIEAGEDAQADMCVARYNELEDAFHALEKIIEDNLRGEARWS